MASASHLLKSTVVQWNIFHFSWCPKEYTDGQHKEGCLSLEKTHIVDRLSHFVEGARFQWTLQSKSSFHTSCSSENSAAKLNKLLHSTCPCSRIHPSSISNRPSRANNKKMHPEP